MKKRILGILLSFSLLAGVVCGNTVQAYGDDGTMFDPVDLGTGGSYTHVWTSESSDYDLYTVFEMEERGVATIKATKTLDNDGDVTGFSLYIYDENGDKVWGGSTVNVESKPVANYTFDVGLDAGNYSLRIERHFYSVSEGVETKFTLKTKADKSWEVESNNDFKKANLLTLNKKITGVYGENDDSDAPDFFKVKLTKGKKYTIKLGNYSKFAESTTIMEVFDSKKKEISLAGWELANNGKVTISPKKTGFYYIKFHNEFGAGVKYTLTVTEKK